MALADRTGTAAPLRALVRMIPLLSGIICAFISNIPVSLTGGALPPPLLALVPIYFWCLVRPDLMTPTTALVIGIAEDTLSGGQVGLWAVSFVTTYALVARSRDSFAGLSGLGAVLGFSVAAAIACSCAYIVTSLSFWSLPQPGPIVSELAMTVLFYIPTAMAIGAIHHQLVGPLRSDV
ncbi:MAG TPA: rod shape-determining protein MreD [Rhizomicrobium sp.]|nr:rod shape-determining protein MreD [Rhizomicrobium sp.]